MTMPKSRTRRWATAAAFVAMTLPMAGCLGGAAAHAVDPPRAREALKTALDGWKAGKTPPSFRESSPPMTVQDLEWSGGARLVEYQIIDDGQARDANLLVHVKLILETPAPRGSKRVEKTVWYLVGTSPSVTVFRDSFHR